MSFESRLQLSLKKGKECCPIKDAFGKNRRPHLVIAPKIQGDAGIVRKTDIAGCSGIGPYSGDGQASVTDDKSPETNENKNRFASLIWVMWGLKH